jgi:hypothetical protein
MSTTSLYKKIILINLFVQNINNNVCANKISVTDHSCSGHSSTANLF